MKLGELFIDLGVNSGGAFNTLSGFAFKMTNIVDLAEKANSFIEQAFGGQARWANNILNSSQALDVSTRTLQGLRIAAMETGTSFDVMEKKLEKLDQERLAFLEGKNDEFGTKMAYFGLTTNDIMEAENALELMQKMITVSQKMGNGWIKESFMRQYGFDVKERRAWINFFRERERFENHHGVLTEQELEDQDEIYLLINRLSIATDTMWNRVSAAKTGAFSGLIEGLAKAEERFADLVVDAQSFSDILAGLPKVFTENEEVAEKWSYWIKQTLLAIKAFGTFISEIAKGNFSGAIAEVDKVLGNNTFLDTKKDIKTESVYIPTGNPIIEFFKSRKSKKINSAPDTKTLSDVIESAVEENVDGLYDEEVIPVNENAAWGMGAVYNDNSTVNLYTNDVEAGMRSVDNSKKAKMNMVYDRK